MHKAVIVTSYPFPDSAATANRVRSLAESLVDSGRWEVVVVGPGPRRGEYPRCANEYRFGVICKDVKGSNTRSLGRRALDELRGTYELYKAAKDISSDVVIVTVPSVFLGFFSLFLGRREVVIDVRDRVWSYLKGYGIGRKVAGSFLAFLLAKPFKKARLVIAINHKDGRALSREMGVSPVVVPNGISKERFTRLRELAAKRIGCGERKAPLKVLYVGNVGVAQELETLIYAVEGDPQYRVTIVGDGRDRERLQALIDERDIENVFMAGPMAWDGVMQHYEKADVLYGQVGEIYKTAVPTKIFEYLSAGRPVVFSCPEGAAREILEDLRGVRVPYSGDVAGLRCALDEVVSLGFDEEVAEENRRVVRNSYLREDLSREFVRSVEGVVEQSPL